MNGWPWVYTKSRQKGRALRRCVRTYRVVRVAAAHPGSDAGKASQFAVYDRKHGKIQARDLTELGQHAVDAVY